MMHVKELLNGIEPNDRTRALIMETFDILADELGLNALPDFTLKVAYVGDDDFEIMPEGTKAGVGPNKYSDTRDLLMLIRQTDPGDVVVAISHEMVHVKQYITGEMRPVGEKDTEWHGEVYFRSYDTMGPETVGEFLEYRDKPWEQEAFERMYELAAVVFNKLPPSEAEWAINARKKKIEHEKLAAQVIGGLLGRLLGRALHV